MIRDNSSLKGLLEDPALAGRSVDLSSTRSVNPLNKRDSVAGGILKYLRETIPGFRRLECLPRQLLGITLLRETAVHLARCSLIGAAITAFPHPWNFHKPLQIWRRFWEADAEQGPGRHNRYLEVPGFAPILVRRDPGIIRAITTETGDAGGQLTATLPSTGIARATEKTHCSLPTARLEKAAETRRPFENDAVPARALRIRATFRNTVHCRLEILRKHLESSGQVRIRIQLS